MKKKAKKLRPMNDVTAAMEKVLEEMTDPSRHDMQWGEVLALVHAWLEIHAPHAQEVYYDDTSPIYYYGHKDHLRK